MGNLILGKKKGICFSRQTLEDEMSNCQSVKMQNDSYLSLNTKMIQLLRTKLSLKREDFRRACIIYIYRSTKQKQVFS